jgi:biopolymer transport protein ExbD
MRVPNHLKNSQRAGTGCELDRAMTAMVDVVFQLLVFFVLASGGRIAEQRLATALSSGAVAAAVTPKAERWDAEVWVHLKRKADDGHTFVSLNHREYADLAKVGDALNELAASAPESPVILDVSQDVPLSDVITIYDTCRGSKFRSINFAASADDLKPLRQ